MIKRKIIETVEEYDEYGDLVKKTVTETTEQDDTQYMPYFPSVNPQYVPYDHTITTNAEHN